MSNPFEFFTSNDSDDQKYQNTPSENKPKRTHAEKRLYKQQQQTTAQKGAANQTATTEPFPEHVKENAKQIRNPRHPPTPLTKKLGEGHFHDRQSGTGRVDKPRKAGGGKGNVGNVKDILNPDKYIKEQPEEAKPAENETGEEVAQEEPQPQQPQALTLEEYYKNKGVDINNTFEKKGPVKKENIEADWIKKEKLTVLQTKEDKKQSERNAQNTVKQTDARSGLDENLGALGFNSKPSKKTEEKRALKPEEKGKGGKGKAKVVINDDDFPSL